MWVGQRMVLSSPEERESMMELRMIDSGELKGNGTHQSERILSFKCGSKSLRLWALTL